MSKNIFIILIKVKYILEDIKMVEIKRLNFIIYW